jgi:2-C-methyl-D-erythritol 4-phosphate cytidylyltransferase
MKDKQKYAIIVAGGIGKRMGGGIPKQFMILKGKPILMHTMEKFHSFDPNIKLILVLPAQQHGEWQELIKQYSFTLQHQLTTGGLERFHSVSNGLQCIPFDGLVAIHDGVRPLVSLETIERCFMGAASYGTAIPVLQATESIRWSDKNSNKAMDRNQFFLVQTPQVFSCKLLKEAYEQPFDIKFTDDASVVEKMGIDVHLVDGNPENIKITRPIDIKIGEVLMEES